MPIATSKPYASHSASHGAPFLGLLLLLIAKPDDQCAVHQGRHVDELVLLSFFRLRGPFGGSRFCFEPTDCADEASLAAVREWKAAQKAAGKDKQGRRTGN